MNRLSDAFRPAASERGLAARRVVHKPVSMAGLDRDRWYEVVAIELARRVGDRYTLSSWAGGVWERARSAGFAPSDAIDLLLQHPPAVNEPAHRTC